MQEMGRNPPVVTEGIPREDWRRGAETAPLIADHPQPPGREKMRILSFIGSAAATVKSHDRETHAAAQTMREEAAQNDGLAAISAFANVPIRCLAGGEIFR